MSQILSISFHTGIFIEVNETIHKCVGFGLPPAFVFHTWGQVKSPGPRYAHSFQWHYEAVMRATCPQCLEGLTTYMLSNLQFLRAAKHQGVTVGQRVMEAAQGSASRSAPQS